VPDTRRHQTQAAPETPVLPRRLVFRTSGAALVAVAFLVLCESVVTFASAWLTLLYLVPLGLAYWLVRTRTVVDADTVTVRRAFTRTVLPWDEIASLRVTAQKWVKAVRADGREIALPSVRTRHLPALAIVSGGRLTDPTLVDIETDTDTEPEAGAGDTGETGAAAVETAPETSAESHQRSAEESGSADPE
jgi:hypothetical protein